METQDIVKLLIVGIVCLILLYLAAAFMPQGGMP